MALADFSRASALGFQQGQQMAEGQNPLGQFVRGMLDEYRKKRAMEMEYGMKLGLAREEANIYKEKETFKQNLESSSPEAQARTKYYSANADYLKKANSQGGDNADIVYRRADTGEEVEAELAKEEIGQGNRNFVITQRQVYKSGVKENPLIQPIKYSAEQESFIADAPVVMEDLKNLINELTPQTKAPLGGFARISSGKRYLLPEKNLRGLQEKYIRARKTILFGPAGKALTGTEREVVESALTPTGKNSEEWERDLTKAYDVLNNKYKVMTKKQLPDFIANSGKNKSLNIQKKTKQYIKEGTDSATGKRVGMLEDGTIEEIQ